MLCAFVALALGTAAPWWDAKVEKSLARAPQQRSAWVAVLAKTNPKHRPGMAYLMTYLPLVDLKTLPPSQLVENVEMAYEVRNAVPWGKKLPEAIFLDAVLPHANTTELRHPWRREFLDKYLPLVKTCKTPGEAALLLNKTLFKDYKVTYNTRRLRTDQSPKETIAQGMATCTGLSIMFVDACRAVGVPARVAGISEWPGRGGNHTWAEVWDAGKWHFVGAAEPDDNGLDHAWFTEDASKAVAEVPANAVYAITYRQTGDYFHTIWSPGNPMNAENVTARYQKKEVQTGSRLMIEVVKGGFRTISDLVVLDAETGEKKFDGKTLGPQSDVNFHATARTTPGRTYIAIVRNRPQTLAKWQPVTGDYVLKFNLSGKDQPIDAAKLAALLAQRFGEDKTKREAAGRILAEMPLDEATKATAWQAYKDSPQHAALRKEYEANTVTAPDRLSPYKWRHVGTKPKEGWGLVIAMHGGGNAGKDVNDGEWNYMFKGYYKEHPEVGGYVYLALRAPNDTWNGFYDDAMCPLVENLIKQFVLFGDVDPNKVTITGASHGGYGAFVIGPKIPYRFSAVHASASAPTDGETRGENLRNVKFSWMVGENDTAYGRAERCQAFAKQIETWKTQYGGGYDATLEFMKGVGHLVPDRENKVKELLSSPARNPWPKHIIWFQTDDVLHNFYWLESSHPVEGGMVEATVTGNTIDLKTKTQRDLTLWLDPNLVDFSKPVVIKLIGAADQKISVKPSLETYCLGLERMADPTAAGLAKITIETGR